MTTKNYKSRFSKAIKLRPEQLKWINETKDTKTAAGYLDKIINSYKNHAVDTEYLQVAEDFGKENSIAQAQE